MKNRALLPIISLLVLLWCLSAATRPASTAVARHTLADDLYQVYLPLVSLTLPKWQPQTPPLSTPWTAEVSPTQVLPEYPRPQLVRSRWLNLNGEWQFESAVEGETPPVGRNLSEAILVPFPIESALSGIMRHHDRMWYRRTFTVPIEWTGERVLLNFGAVDWEATVYVNGQLVGSHRGGYDAFSLDITDQLNGGLNELIVNVYDPTNAANPPLGKQRLNGTGIWYTPASGIWQTVWLEPVPAAHITGLKLTPDLDQQAVQLLVSGEGLGAHTIEASVWHSSTLVASATGSVSSPMTISIPAPHLWSPDDPFLYDVQVDLKLGSTVVDHISSYFGMRKIGLERIDQYMRLLLNNQFVFQIGVLNQGYWPDGIYTAPTDEALRFDLEQAKALGYNLVRLHMKVEPARWYYWADKLGLMVWQDMPAMRDGHTPSEEDRVQFEVELKEMIDERSNSPAIVMWVLFNESWGQYDTTRLTSLIKSWDPSRLVDSASGWRDEGIGDVVDRHIYVEPAAPQPEANRASVLGEFGGLGLKIVGHTWGIVGYAYEWHTNGASLQDRYVSFIPQLQDLMHNSGLSAAVYTQLVDVEGERTGWLTYDRVVTKIDATALRAAHQNLIADSALAAISGIPH
ncbi:MAG: glycoside hydrolase family 2 [Chloroflexi bacterium]|nr:glycoside hydrolase family 2 [Chloroflexota bacterium]